MLTPPRKHSLIPLSFGSILHSRKNVTWGWPQGPLGPVLESPDSSPDDLNAPRERRIQDHIWIFCPLFHPKRIRLLPTSQEGGKSLESISWLWHSFSSVQSLSHAWLFVTPWTAPRQASLSFSKSHSLLKLMSIESVMPSKHLIFCHPLLLPSLIFPSIRVFSNEPVLCIRWPKYWSFSFSISPSNEYSGLISIDLLAVHGTLKSLLQHHSSKVLILRNSTFFIVQLLHLYLTTGKTIALTRWHLAMSLLFNMLSRLVITFLPRSKRLLFHGCSHHLQWFWSTRK